LPGTSSENRIGVPADNSILETPWRRPDAVTGREVS
jgi:hypothetical protein